jgi:hypothetical protein
MGRRSGRVPNEHEDRTGGQLYLYLGGKKLTRRWGRTESRSSFCLLALSSENGSNSLLEELDEEVA